MGRPAKIKDSTVDSSTVESVSNGTETIDTETETIDTETETTQPEKVEIKPVSQSTKEVSFEWTSGNKSGKTETMSENVAEVLERKNLGKKVK